MAAFPGEAWLRRLEEVVARDAELGLVGEWFTTSLSLTFGERRVILRVERGRIAETVPEPRLDVRCTFGFRAPLVIVQWQKGEPVTVFPPELAFAKPIWPK